MGMEPGRLKLTWASASEGAKFTEEVTSFVEQVRALGPLNWPAAPAYDIHPAEMLTAE
jgi:coenzyme F420-reducing hydrogenase delta subunit